MAGMAVRKAPYKDFLQPALQRRFSLTAIILLAVAYLEAVLSANWNSYFWTWFPLGPAGFRTAFIFTCGIAILILRIAHYHVGLRTTSSGLQTLASSLTNLQAYETAFWYGFSSLGYCPIFLWSMPDGANLRWIVYFSGDRARLNERPLFLTCYMGTVALVQTLVHYQVDTDRLDLGAATTNGKGQQSNSGDMSGSLKAIVQQLPAILARTVMRAVLTLPLALILYYGFLRSFLWGWALMFFRPFFNLPKTNMVPPTWPSDIFLLARCVYCGALVFFLWAVGNAAFSAFMVKEPLKNGKPLTSDSKDPNGSLLTGLKSKKLAIKSFAMWELAHISESFVTRRQAIYEDIDRKDGPMWSQVYATCMDLVKSVETRVDEFGKPPAPAPTEAGTSIPSQRITAPLRDDPILTSRAQPATLTNGVKKAISQVANSPGSSPVSQLSPLAKKVWKDARDQVLSKSQQEAISPGHLKSQFEHLVLNVMAIDGIGDLFRHDFRTRFAAVVLGTPYAEPTVYSHAVQSLCQLAVHSLAEDQFGNVHRDVPSIVRTLTAVIRKVEALKLRFPTHWTDVKKVRDSPEVDEVLEAMRTGLGQVVASFEPFSNDLRLTLGDLRLAKEAAAKPKAATQTEQKKLEKKGDERPVEMEQARPAVRAARARRS